MNTSKLNVFLVLALLLTLGTASTATAGGSIFGGVNFPTGGFSDAAKTGWNAGATYSFDLMPIVDLGAYLAYSDFSTSATDIQAIDDALGGSINVWELHALGSLKILFLKGSLGLGVASYKDVDENFESSRSTDFSWQIGLAASFAMLEARLAYHQIPVDESSINWMSLTLGLSF